MMMKAKLWRTLAMAAAVGTAMNVGVAQAKQPGSLQLNSPITELTFDVLNIANNDERGAESNVVRELFVGAAASINSLKWDINVTSHAGSYLSEMQLTISDSTGYGVTFTPGDGDEFDGSAHYAGFEDLRALGQSFHVGADGVLRLEFHDGYKDLAFDEPEGIWNSGTLTFGVSPVPEPQTYAFMLVGLLSVLAAAKRSRNA